LIAGDAGDAVVGGERTVHEGLGRGQKSVEVALAAQGEVSRESLGFLEQESPDLDRERRVKRLTDRAKIRTVYPEQP